MATVTSTLMLVDNMSKKLEQIQKHVDDLAKSMGGVETAAEDASKAGSGLSKFGQTAQNVGNTMRSTGTRMTMWITDPLYRLGTTAYDAAVEYEAAFAGVRKTTEASEAEFAELDKGLRALSEQTATDYPALSAIAEMAGQLGVAKDDLLEFTRIYDQLQISTNIQGETGAADIAKFLNITEGGTQNIARFGGTIVDLGNNFATTEQDILHMATRMASTGDLVGMSVPDILAMATALSSLGIEAEAGGSSAGKLMKKMQMAAEVGTKDWTQLMAAAQIEFPQANIQNMHDLQMQMDLMKSSEVKAWAVSMGMTADELTKAVGMAADMEYFSQISGKTAEEFAKDWANNPAQSMLDFFTGLNKLDQSGVESAISMLEKMGITEIRLSNMVAALTSNPEMLAKAISMAYSAYAVDPTNNALFEEFEKFISTQDSQNKMLQNKIKNTEANFGQNLVTALQPALNILNDLLTAFNNLSEADQQAVINTFMVFAAAGPVTNAIGSTVDAIGKVSTGMGNIVAKAGGWGKLLDVTLASPAFWGVAAGGAILLLATYLDSIPTQMEKITSAAANIPITIDQETYTATMGQIDAVQKALEGLKPGETNQEYEGVSLAVSMGVGTNNMFGQAIAYEAQKTNTQISQIASDYGEKMKAAEDKIVAASKSGDQIAAAAAQAEYNALKSELETTLNAVRSEYTAKISELFNGMASQYPEYAGVLEQAVKQYDLLSMIAQAGTMDSNDAGYKSLIQNIFTQAFDLGYLEKYGYTTAEQVANAVQDGLIGYSDLVLGSNNVNTMAAAAMTQALQSVSDNPILSSLLSSIVNNDLIAENLDLTNAQGALDGIIKTLDFQSAAKDAEEQGGGIGKYLDLGMKAGIEDGSSAVAAAVRAMVQNAIESGNAVARIASPSKETRWSGEMMVAGYVSGLEHGSTDVEKAVGDLMTNTINEWEGITEADAKKIQQLAERDAINRVSYPSIKVNMTNNNNINDKMDIDTVVSYLEEHLSERLEMVAEGVY